MIALRGAIHAVGIVFMVENGEIVESWVELVVPKTQGAMDPAIESHLRKLSSRYKFKNVVPGRYYERYKLTLMNGGKTTNLSINQSEALLMRIVQGILTMLKECKIPTRPYSLVYRR